MPGTVAVVADEGDFARMRHYRSFAFDDHPGYLRQVEALLRSLTGRGLHTRLVVFDPWEYAEFCSAAGLDPDSARSRTLYTAEAAACGAGLTSVGEPLRELLPHLLYVRERGRTWDRVMEQLSLAGRCERCGRDVGQAAFERATHAVEELLHVTGPSAGERTLVCSAHAPGRALVASVTITPGADPRTETVPGLLLLCGVLAVAFAGRRPGGLVLRTLPAPPPGDGSGRKEEVRGWKARDGWLTPLTDAQVFDAYCTHAETGEPVPPEPGVEHLPGIPLPRPDGDLHC
jgi:hypothetical protein